MTVSRQVEKISDVLEAGLCIGCGACAVNSDSIKIDRNHNGFYQPVFDPETTFEANTICPFSNRSADEDQISTALFAEKCQSKDDVIGWYDDLFMGSVSADEDRLKSSSGGLTTWFAIQLLEADIIDHFVGVGELVSEDGAIDFGYKVVHDREGIESLRGTKYYPVKLDQVVEHILEHDGRYAIVGVPCFIKAVRLLMAENDVLKSRIVCCISIICGHLKSSYYYEMMVRQLGSLPQDVRSFNFRKKFPGTNAHDYGVEVGDSGGGKSAKARSMFGTNWGHCMLKYKACDLCDDIFGEVADVVFGDAWVEQFAKDWKGNNLVVCRGKEWSEVFERGQSSGMLSLSSVSKELVIKTQAGSVRQKQLMIGYRLRLLRLFSNVELKKRYGQDEVSLLGKIKCIQRTVLRWLSVTLYPKGGTKTGFICYRLLMLVPICFFGVLVRIVAIFTGRR